DAPGTRRRPQRSARGPRRRGRPRRGARERPSGRGRPRCPRRRAASPRPSAETNRERRPHPTRGVVFRSGGRGAPRAGRRDRARAGPRVSSPATARRDAAKQAVDRLRDLIVQGEFSAGERLPPERVLARELGVSRSTLREAIRALVVMNVLVSRHGDGTYVSSLEPDLLAEPFELMVSLSDESLFHLFEVRRVLE